MRFWKRGKTTTAVVDEVTDQGFRLRVNGEAFWVSFEDYPMFRGADPEILRSGLEVLPSGVWWEELDEGIEFEALRHPERYPLVGRVRHKHKTAIG